MHCTMSVGPEEQRPLRRKIRSESWVDEFGPSPRLRRKAIFPHSPSRPFTFPHSPRYLCVSVYLLDLINQLLE